MRNYLFKTSLSIVLFMFLSFSPFGGLRGIAQYTIMHNFNGSDGSEPYGDLINDGTYLYGMTSQEDGTGKGKGNIFKIKIADNSFTDIYDFGTIAGDGQDPNGSLFSDGTYLYGMTKNGGANSKGNIFKIKIADNSFTDMYDFNWSDGANPCGSLISDGTYLYGMTLDGGTNGYGNIFKIKIADNSFTDMYDFGNGANPNGSLISDGNYLYGMTYRGGTNSYDNVFKGNIFKIKIADNSFTDMHDFNGNDGLWPYGSLISDGTYLYGMTLDGGANFKGNIFKIKITDNSFTDMYDFGTTAGDGAGPHGSLISDGIYLYGMTLDGGANFKGNIFRIKIADNSFTDMHDFNGNDGLQPYGSLINDGTYLYGMTYEGGTNNKGVVFKFNISNILWAGTTNTDWNTASNWIGNTVPATGANVVIPVVTTNNYPVVNSSVTVNSITVQPTASLSVSSGNSLTVSSGLTLQSDVTGSASIGQSSGSIIGNVTIQRYIGTSVQWRMIGFPLTSGTSISYSSIADSCYWYDETKDNGAYGSTDGTNPNSGWISLGKGNTTADKGILVINSPYNTRNLFSISGTLNTGTQNITLSKNNSGWNFIANPYASNINWTTISANNSSLINNAIYRYDPNSTAYASYVNGISSGNLNNVIENGAGFFVQATAAGSLQIQESDKTTTVPIATLMGTGTQRGSVGLDGDSSSSSTAAIASVVRLTLKQDGDTYGDEAVALWGGGVPATDEFDGKYDAYDLGRMKGANLGIVDNKGVNYSIFHGSELKASDVENRTVALKVSQLTEGSYTLSASIESSIANGNQLSIYDSYLNQYTLIDGNSKTYSFTITGDAASSTSGRFSLVMNAKPKTGNSNSTVSLLNNPTTNNSFMLYTQTNYNTLQWQLVDANGTNIGTGQLNSVQKGGTYNVTTPVITSGIYFIKLTGDNKKLNTLKLMKQ